MQGEIEVRVKKIKAELAAGNPFGERVSLVAATKQRTVDEINEAIRAGVDAVAENRVQEFCKKVGLSPCPKHFIGHLQTNKVKYLVGAVDLIHSCDRDELAEEIAVLSVRKGIVTPVLLQVNVGNESTKGGYLFEEAFDAFLKWRAREGLKVEGFMAMLPRTDDESTLKNLACSMRELYERAREKDEKIDKLSMGMSGDYRLCVECGGNAVRLGSCLFGERK